MNRLTDLFLDYAPVIALIGGAVILVWSILHLAGLATLPGIEPQRRLSPLASLLLGCAIFGLGVTYILTEGRIGYESRYSALLWLAALSGVLGLLSNRR